MSPLSRALFLKQCIAYGTLIGLAPYATFAAPISAADDFYKRIVDANGKEVDKLIDALTPEITNVRRRLGFDMANLAAAYCEPTSGYYQKNTLVPYMEKIVRALIQAQHEDGTLDLGNLASPPDTAFILEPLCAGATILSSNSSPALSNVKASLRQFITKAGEAMRTGGIHTPNHRWVVSGALAKINALYPNPGYVKRIDEWLSEGVYCDSEGNYLERSMIYSEVIDRSLITMASLLKRPKLLEPVRRNLNLVYYHTEPNGDLVSFDSRRQDQYQTINLLNHHYFQDYMYMAIQDKNPEFAAMAAFIASMPHFDELVLKDLLPYYLEEPLFKQAAPSPKSLPVTYEKFFKATNLVRIRRNETTTTLFGGTDFPLLIASGRANSPNIFAFRKGKAILNYLRLSTDFFSTGYFHSEGITKVGNKYVLQRTIEAPYYQPLPAQYKKPDGNYKHSPSTDGRFWNKMDFEHRPKSNINKLAVTVSVEEKNGTNTLAFSVTGITGVRVVIELCFNEGGRLTGVKKLDDGTDNYALESGTGEYKAGGDSINFGPGTFQHTKLTGLEGELYATHFGTLRTPGLHVYMTGLTPFTHTITIG
ncbi:hypothetical protein [Fibrivirga algicola]|uniref:Uncharacterized protein n=1 Tax=Fibrivirga algicola TaxID=2950420 RepID=A0ABX0QLI4_9BACT|nr:hypothetical protein [Fibrivirga algicola]NID12015.1 hypothetical protein [Fibrivirga algicola]